MNIYFTYNTQKDFDSFLNVENLKDYAIHHIDSGTLHGKKEAYKLKSEWGAKLDPFILIIDDKNKPIKAFYSECKTDAITQFTQYSNKET